jgi:tetratricopeptide (TPR) repeat protein
MFTGPEKFAEVFKDVLRDERAQQVRWMHWHANAGLKVPSLKEVQPGVPPLISKIVDRMMEKDPSKRFASAEQIIRWLRRIFVMHVQGKSVSLTDSETLEKEIEAEASAPTLPAVRAPGKGLAGRGGADVPAVVEKTAPIPQPKLTWKKAAFYGAVIGGPLVLLAVGLLIWNHYRWAGIQDRARTAIQEADVLYDQGQWPEAAAAYDKIKREYADLKSYAVYAHLKSLMARAENALAKKEWDEADRAWDEAAKNGATSNWSHGFQERLAASRNVEQRVAEAKRAERAQKYEEAIALLEQLRASYPDADKYAGEDLGKWITELQYNQVNREYLQKMLEGKTALEKGLLDEAVRLFQEARKIRETPEVVELIQTVTNRKEFIRFEVLGDRYAADRKWPEAADAYAKARAIQPSEAVKKKMDNAKAESLAVDARALKAAGASVEAQKKWSEVLQYNPQHPEALKEKQRSAVAEQLASAISAGDQAMAQKQWEPAVRSYEDALKLLDPSDAQTKRIQGQIAEARYEAAMEQGRDALARRAWEEARSKLNQAKALKDSPEVIELLARLTDDQAHYQLLDLGKELMAQGKIVDAIKVFQDALKKRDTQEVRDLIDEGYYGMYLAKARYYLSRNELEPVSGFLELARKYANDDKKKIEVQGLQQEANRLRKEQASEGKG